MLPPSEPTMKMFLLMMDWHIVNPLTGITTFYFFRSIRNPLIGYFKSILFLPYYTKAGFGTSQSSILPSEPRESKL
jgi:hypothetical protein